MSWDLETCTDSEKVVDGGAVLRVRDCTKNSSLCKTCSHVCSSFYLF